MEDKLISEVEILRMFRVEETGVGTYEKQFEFDFCESI